MTATGGVVRYITPAGIIKKGLDIIFDFRMARVNGSKKTLLSPAA